MNQPYPRDRAVALEGSFGAVPAELVGFVKKMYGLLSFSLFLAAASCAAMLRLMPLRTFTTIDGGTVQLPALPGWASLALLGGTLGFLVMSWFVKNGARSGEASPFGLVALSGFVACCGAGLAPVIGAYLGLGMATTVAAAAGITAFTFTGLTAFVLITGRDFSFLGKFLFVAILALFLAGIAGFFIHSPQFHWWRAAIGVIIFCGFILFDTSNVVRVYGPRNMVVPAVIALFLDILNLFLLLLQVLGAGRRRD